MMMNNNLKIKLSLYLLFIIFFGITFVAFTGTLALFEDNANGTADLDIGAWVIKINNNSITNGSIENITISNFVYDTNATVTNGTIAPGMGAYTDLVFDASECDVAVRYDIEFKYYQMTYQNNVVFDVEQMGNNTVVRTGEFTYSGIIDLNSIATNGTSTIRVKINWLDYNNETYNDSDTLLGTVADNRFRIPVEVHAIQYLGEQLVPYDSNGTSLDGVITFVSRSDPNSVSVGDVISIRDYGSFYVTYTNNNITRMFPYYNLNIGPNKLSGLRDYAQDASLIHNNGQNVFSTSDYWTGHIGTDYSGSNNGNPYPYVFDHNSSLYSYTLDYRDILSALGLTGVNVRLQTYEEAESLLSSNNSLTCATTYWLGSSRWGSIFILESASTCELKAVSYSAASGRGFRPIIEFATDSLL